MLSTVKSRLRNSAGGSIAAVPRAPLDQHERHRGDHPDQRRAEHRHRAVAALGRLDQGVRDAGQPDGAEQRAERRRSCCGPAGGSSRLSGTHRRRGEHHDARASGTLRRKIHRQESASISQPPTNGPSAVDTPARPTRCRSPGPGRRGGSWPGAAPASPGSAAPPPAPCRNRARDEALDVRREPAQHRGDGEPRPRRAGRSAAARTGRRAPRRAARTRRASAGSR